MPRIVITGAAGLIGQNLIARLAAKPGYTVVGIDKHPENTAILRKLHPGVEVIEADLAQPGAWSASFAGADAVIVNQAQIGGLFRDEFVANNIKATENILAAAAEFNVPYVVGMSSSVVNSKAQDLYSETKRLQEALFDACAIPHVVLRPTLMFGWFDRKHLGWLRRFMDRMPVFPIPGRGNFIRQPLYAGDMAAIIASCVESRPTGTYDISGQERITYGALIRLIHDTVSPKARIVHIPYRLFWLLLWFYAKFNSNPPFTTTQLEALVIPETFPVIDWPGIFNVPATPLAEAMRETFLDPRYAQITLSF
ncbi:NAD-dependent epimerase/dehydratase family protein [Acidisoma silvae]|uniref:NAD-dependent epimerase/dehydratase family protein n=1 Tax=Acidisoma silvae TaxID=2802396 RepID=A0A964E1M0_9PROT|nr:NAD-dependent epimerase/dehydratase family protein [Acidisoma silvae]MCB8878384.1 NAD-dependent epimerase/dehydratase family protein [Acidisoma silvae]